LLNKIKITGVPSDWGPYEGLMRRRKRGVEERKEKDLLDILRESITLQMQRDSTDPC
jgi:hypothetical protein